MTAEMQSVTQRLDRVERENRRLRFGLLAILLVAGGALVTGLTVEDPVVGAEAFTVLDEKGEPRAVFAMVNAEPTLALFDAQGRVRAGLSVVENAPRFILYDENGGAIWTAP